MKKFLSILLAAAAVFSLTGCNDDTPASTPDSSVVSDSSVDTPENGGQLSNPVKFGEDGDIDMTAALAYRTDFDALKASFAAKTVDPSMPVSENAQKNEKTMEVWNYLRSVYGKQTLTCQQMMGQEAYEDIVFYNASKDITAMKGFDFIFSTGTYRNDYMIDEAIEWSKHSGGLVTFTWHWNVPRDIDNLDMGSAFYTEEIINFNQINAVTPGTKEYEQVIHDIDLIASKIQRMESEGITILFRPLHEASGKWFWWGVMGRDSATNEVFQKLWYMIYDRMENYHKLSNIIWVWNGQNKHCAIHPNAFDIAGVDRYYDKQDTSREAISKYYDVCYDECVRYEGDCAEVAGMETAGKMLALTECGYMPDPEGIKASGNIWLYYMVWDGSFVFEASPSGAAIVSFDGTPSPNTDRLTNEMIAEYFSNDLFITHSKLPKFSFGEQNITKAIENWEYFKMG